MIFRQSAPSRKKMQEVFLSHNRLLPEPVKKHLAAGLEVCKVGTMNRHQRKAESSTHQPGSTDQEGTPAIDGSGDDTGHLQGQIYLALML